MAPGDFDALLQIFSDRRVMDGFGVPPFAPEQMRRWLDRNLRHQERYGYGLFSVVRREDGTLIGNCGLEVMEEGVELGYDFRSDCWGRGYATEAALAVRDFAFHEFRLRRLISLIRSGNGASERVAIKVGMTLEHEFQRGEIRYRLFSMSDGSDREPPAGP